MQFLFQNTSWNSRKLVIGAPPSEAFDVGKRALVFQGKAELSPHRSDEQTGHGSCPAFSLRSRPSTGQVSLSGKSRMTGLDGEHIVSACRSARLRRPSGGRCSRNP